MAEYCPAEYKMTTININDIINDNKEFLDYFIESLTESVKLRNERDVIKYFSCLMGPIQRLGLLGNQLLDIKDPVKLNIYNNQTFLFTCNIEYRPDPKAQSTIWKWLPQDDEHLSFSL